MLGYVGFLLLVCTYLMKKRDRTYWGFSIIIGVCFLAELVSTRGPFSIFLAQLTILFISLHKWFTYKDAP